MATGFSTRERGLRDREENREMANDMANINRLAPAVQGQHQAGSWQAEQLRNIGQKNKLTADTAQTLRMSREMDRRDELQRAQEIRSLATMALQKRGQTFSQQMNLANLGLRIKDQKFDQARLGRQEGMQVDKWIADLYKTFNPEDVDKFLTQRGYPTQRGVGSPPVAGAPAGMGTGVGAAGAPVVGAGTGTPVGAGQTDASGTKFDPNKHIILNGQPFRMNGNFVNNPYADQAEPPAATGVKEDAGGTVASYSPKRDKGVEFREARRGEWNGQDGLLLRDGDGNMRFVGANAKGEAGELYNKIAPSVSGDVERGDWVGLPYTEEKAAAKQAPQERAGLRLLPKDIKSAKAAVKGGDPSKTFGIFARIAEEDGVPLDEIYNPENGKLTVRGNIMKESLSAIAKQNPDMDVNEMAKRAAKVSGLKTTRESAMAEIEELELQNIKEEGHVDPEILGIESTEFKERAKRAKELRQKYGISKESESEKPKTVNVDAREAIKALTAGEDADDRVAARDSLRRMLANPKDNKANLVDVVLQSEGKSVKQLFGRDIVKKAKDKVARDLGVGDEMLLSEKRMRKLFEQKYGDPKAYDRALKKELYDLSNFWGISSGRAFSTVQKTVRDLVNNKVKGLSESPLAAEQIKKRRKNKN